MADENRILQSMRQMAWERGKAEINSMFCTMYWEDQVTEKSREVFRKAWKEFVETVEDNGLHE